MTAIYSYNCSLYLLVQFIIGQQLNIKIFSFLNYRGDSKFDYLQHNISYSILLNIIIKFITYKFHATKKRE